MKSTVILVTDGIYPNVIGGMQMHSLRLLEEWLKMDVNVIVFQPKVLNDAMPTYFHEQILLKKLTIYSVPKKSEYKWAWSYLYSEICYAFRVKKMLKKMPARPIYSQGLSGLFIGGLWRKQKLTHLANPHGLEPFQDFFNTSKSAKFYQWLFKLNFNQASHVVSLGGNLTEILNNIGIDDRKIVVLPNGIATSWITDEIFSPSGKEIKCLFIGRNEKRKGLENLLDVFKGLQSESIKLTIVGPIKAEQHQKVYSINYLGAVSEEKTLKKILDQHDVLICPSFAEGMPTVILEAMARGLAVIATDVGAVSELVSNENGWLLPVLNKEELEKAISDLLTLSPANIRDKKNASLVKIKNFVWCEIARNTLVKMGVQV